MHPGCAVGTRGWDHAQWTGRYYPDDLPSSWRLSFYANDFTGVLVPAVQWRAAGRATLARWRQDVPAGFRFFFETEMGARPPQPPADWLQEVLGETFGGWVGPGDETPCAGLRAANLDAIVDAGIDTGIDTGQRHSADVVLAAPATWPSAAGSARPSRRSPGNHRWSRQYFCSMIWTPNRPGNCGCWRNLSASLDVSSLQEENFSVYADQRAPCQ